MSNQQQPEGSQGGNVSFTDLTSYCFDNADAPECADIDGYYQYDLSLAANVIFLALFSLSLILFLAVFAIKRRGTAFTVALSLGCVCEILGYAGRIMSAENRFSENGFLIQICCLTIGPAFMAAGIYLCLRRIVYAFGEGASRIKPELYTRIFIPCDVVSLVLQAVGGGMASVASHNDDLDGVERGDNIMIAGLSFQVFTLFCFMSISIDFGIRTYIRHKTLGASALDQDPEMVKVRKSPMFKGFLVALTISTLGIFIRSIFRVAELSRGWTGPIMGRQDLFIGFEGVCVVVATLVLNVFHPAICFSKMLEGKGGISFGRKKKNNQESEVIEGKGESGPGSDQGSRKGVV